MGSEGTRDSHGLESGAKSGGHTAHCGRLR